MKLPISLEETVQLPVTVVPVADPVGDPLVDTAVHGELVVEPGAHRQALRLGKRTRVALGTAAAFVVLFIVGAVVIGTGGPGVEPAAGPVAPAVVAPPSASSSASTSSSASPPSSSVELAPPAATETLAATTKTAASAEVRADVKTTAAPPPKPSPTSESVNPTAAAISSFMREIEKRYGSMPPQPSR
jgi:hypothetical protein